MGAEAYSPYNAGTIGQPLETPGQNALLLTSDQPRVRAKFYVEGVTPQSEDGSVNVSLRAVTDDSPENETWAMYTPSGQITLNTLNTQAAEVFRLDTEFYVDFTPDG